MADLKKIDLNILNVENNIQKLRALRAECDNYRINTQMVESGGKTAEEIEQILGTYKEINYELINLLSNTEQFLLNIAESFYKADSELANSIIE